MADGCRLCGVRSSFWFLLFREFERGFADGKELLFVDSYSVNGFMTIMLYHTCIVFVGDKS